MTLSVMIDKKTKWWFARYRSDGQHHAVRIGKKDDRLHSEKDVRKSPEFKTIEAQVNGGDTDPNSRQVTAGCDGR